MGVPPACGDESDEEERAYDSCRRAAEVEVIMGSDSDWPVMAERCGGAGEVRHSGRVRDVSTHRTELMFSCSAARRARSQVIIARSGRGRALAREVWSPPRRTAGIDRVAEYRWAGWFDLDSLLSIVQMPAGFQWPRCPSGRR